MAKQKSIYKCIITLGIAVIMIVSMAVSNVYALDPIDFDEESTLAVQFTGDDVKVPGMEFKAYRIADFSGEGTLSMNDRYAAFGVGEVPEDQEGYRALASTLKGYIDRDGLKADYTATTDADGTASFGVVEKGLYLIISDVVEYDGYRYRTSPAMVSVPNLDESEKWNHAVVLRPKYTSEAIPVEKRTMDINAVKVWKNDKEEDRAAFVEVDLVCNGEIIKTERLSKENNWRVSWKDLDADAEYEVTESTVVPGYTVSIEREGNTFTVSNIGDSPTKEKEVQGVKEEPKKEPVEEQKTPPTPPSQPTKSDKLPQTGQLWWPVPVLIGSGILFLGVGLIRKRRAQ